MGLKVWFPLNGNYLSYGLQTYSDITYNGTLDSVGKIGSCYAFSQKYFRINGSMINGLDEFTVACWVYLTSTTYNIFTFETSNAYWQFALNNNYLRVRDTVTGATGTRKDLAITAIPQTTWTHVTVTYNKGSIKVYQDGVLKDTLTGNANASIVSTTTVLCIGADPVNSTSTYPGNCKVNDFRVYEHALSQKEIKELARGLIIHYPLCTRESVLSKYSSVNWNQLAENGNFANSYNNWTILHTSSQSASVTNGVLTLTKVNTTTNIGAILYSNAITINSSNVGHLFYIKGESRPTNTALCSIGFSNSGGAIGGNTQLYNYDNEWKTLSDVVSPANSGNLFMVRAGSSADAAGTYAQFKNVMCIDLTQMFGSGNEPSKEMCDLIFIDNYYTYDTGTTKSLVSPIYDESGYGRNATMTSSYFNLSDDTRRYDYSTVCNGSSYLQVASPSQEVRTISLWVNWSSIPSGQSIVFVDQYSKMGLGLMNTGILCSTNAVNSYTFSKANIVANTWYHFVIVNTGTSASNTTRDLYINGVKQNATSNTSYWTYALNYLQIGKRSTTSDGFSGKISDFRMYVTPLSDEDVLDLYENSATVDNFGSLHCYETKETADNLFTFENLQEDASGTISITTANDEPAIAVPGNAFQGSSHRFFEGRFQPNTQYKFDIWLDCYGASMGMGICVYYTDNTSSGQALIDFAINTPGFKHKVYYSDSSKSISYLGPYNGVSNPAYYRTDSVIIPMNNPTNIERTGVVDTGCFREDTTEVSIGKGDNFDVNNLIEK